MISAFFSRIIILVFGTLFPAYYSYKAVKAKNIKEYVKWMMYWIVFAFFTCMETVTDMFLAFWFPFYYETKIILVLWLLSPATRGSSVLYRKFVHPWLTEREEDIDDCIARAKQQGYSTVLQLGTKGVNYATNVIMQTAIKGGGGLVNQLKRGCSVGELAMDDADGHAGDHNRNLKALPPSDDYSHHPPTTYYSGTNKSSAGIGGRENEVVSKQSSKFSLQSLKQPSLLDNPETYLSEDQSSSDETPVQPTRKSTRQRKRLF